MLKKILLVLITLIGLVLFSFYYPDISREELWERYAYSKSQTMDLAGMPVHYRDVGQGAPVVLLHGTGASLHTWHGWVDYMLDSFRLITVDLPAFGLTGPHPERDYSISSYVEFVDQFVQQLELDTFSLAGNSLGGLIAWAYTAKHPDRVSELILLAPSGFPGLSAADQSPPLPMRLAQNSITAALLKKVTPKFIIRNSLLDVYADDSKVHESLVERYFSMSLRTGNRQAFVDRSNTTRRVDTMLLANIQQPTLILWGEEDKWIPVGDAARFAALLPRDTVVILPNVGHVPMEEEPLMTAKIAAAWLQEKYAEREKKKGEHKLSLENGM